MILPALQVKELMSIPCQVVKGDGSLVHYRPQAVYRSVLKASQDQVLALKLTHRLSQKIHSPRISSADIARQVIQMLEEMGWEEAAQSYQAYHDRKKEKQRKDRDLTVKISQLKQGDRKVINENANKDSRVFNTLRDLTAGACAKAQGLRMLPERVAKAHQKGDIHFHDLDYSPYTPMTNCCLIDVKYMMEKGFEIGNADVATPKSINTATAQIAQIIANVASCQYGGCTIDRIDELLAPYADMNYRKHLITGKRWVPGEEDQEAYAREKTEKDIYDAMQSLEYEINTLFSSNGQTPFTTIGFGLGRDWYARTIQQAILKIRLKGLGKSQRTAIFPKLVFTLKDQVNLKPVDPNYDIKQLALKCATHRMYPDVIMYDKIVELTGSFKAPMGCRSFLQGWVNEAGEEVNAGRMNLGVVTLNLPRIAMESNGSQEEFWQIFQERMQVVREALVYRLERTKEATPDNAPILYQHGAFGHQLAKDDPVDKVFCNKRATISLGYIGLYETTAYFYGAEWEQEAEAKAFSLDILKQLKTQADQWGNQYGYHVSVYSTPSESLTDRFCSLDYDKFGSVENITDKGYYTNSFHYDVRKDPSPFEKIDFEADYPKYCAGGFIHYCEYPNMQQNPKALEAVWDYAYDKVGYLGTNTPIDYCYECDFKGDFIATERGFKCPQCGNSDPDRCDVVKRTCGYLGNPNIRPMVHGRHKEIAARVKHLKNGQHSHLDSKTRLIQLQNGGRDD